MTTYSEPIKILCVDDERNVLRSLERIFLDDDYEIVLANSGEEGLAALDESGPFQVIVSDYRMPVMNGVQFLTKVYERWPETVRIVLSGYADAGAIVEAINQGHIYKFIPKPWNDEELRVTIQNCLERYFLQKQNRELVEKLAAANQVLEDKVRERTERLEVQLAALDFSQRLFSLLPVGVVGVDENNMIVVCNTVAIELLNSVCNITLGGDVNSSCNLAFSTLVQRVRDEKRLDGTIDLNGRSWRVLGQNSRINDSDATILVFVEVAA